MKKDRVYGITIVLQESNCSVSTAYCSCPAGLVTMQLQHCIAWRITFT